MAKKIIAMLIVMAMLVCASACQKKTKQLTCDGCGKTVEVDADSNMNDDWILFCDECGEPEIEF